MTESSAVLAAVKDALRAPLGGGLRPSLTAAARDASGCRRPGRRNGPQPNQETLQGAGRRPACKPVGPGWMTSGLTVHITVDHVFALCHLLGYRFVPRMRDLQDRRLAIIGSSSKSSHSATARDQAAAWASDVASQAENWPSSAGVRPLSRRTSQSAAAFARARWPTRAALRCGSVIESPPHGQAGSAPRAPCVSRRSRSCKPPARRDRPIARRWSGPG